MKTQSISREEKTLNKFLEEINAKSNKLIEYFLFGYFACGLIFASYYDTWFVGISIGGLILASYYISKMMFQKQTVNQYVASSGLAIFMGQFIYQMHGLFEMHFFAFIGSTLLITYQNWKNLIPYSIFTVLHHALFAYLQFSGNNKVFFTQLEYMNLSTFLIHASLATVIFFICGLWAYVLRQNTIRNTQNLLIMEDLSNKLGKNLEFTFALAKGKLDEEYSIEEGDLVGQSLKRIQELLVSNAKNQIKN